jgi:membrane associated rhomboid family serine protease
MIFPIGRDNAVIQRHAWVSYSIIALNVIVFAITSVAGRGPALQNAENDWQTTMQFYAQHPYLRVSPAVAGLVPEKLQEMARDAQPPRGMLPRQIRTEQLELDDLAARLASSYHEIPSIKYGYVPAESGPLNVLTSMFMHADFMHLLGNMLFFFVCAPFIEDVFGRPLFTILYLAGGAVATLGYAAKHPTSEVPLVGASGAIAAIMGAYLVRFLKSKLEFIYIPLIFRPSWNYRFFVPAFIVLPLWFVQQWWASAAVEDSGAGVAFSAHVFGFVFGFFFALLVKFTKFEEKFVAPVVQKQVLWTADPRYTSALEAQAAGKLEEAKKHLGPLLKEQPQHFGALQLMVDLGRETEDWPLLDTYATRLLSRYAEEKDEHSAIEVINSLTADRHARPPIPRFLARAGQFVERIGDHEWALSFYERVCDVEIRGPNAVPSLVRLGNARKMKGDLAGARVAFNNARYHPECSEEWAHNIDAKLAALDGA